MLGFAPLGTLALGQLDLGLGEGIVARHPPGAGKHPAFPAYVPQPPYDAKPSKPFRPIWDRRRAAEAATKIIIETEAAGVPALPPAELFAGLSTAAPLAPALPKFDHLVPGDPLGLAARMRTAQQNTTDMQDALDVLEALKLLTRH